MKNYPKGSLLSVLLALGLNASAEEVKVHINSGNPAYPFPQFLEYSCGGNLGTKLPVGLSHAEMEQQIRQAYQQFAYSFKYTGDEFANVKYIKGNEGCPYDCTEGDGYALLAAAYMADKVTFDGLWMRIHDLRRAKAKTYKDCKDINPNYQYGDHIMNDNGDISDSAADGDEDVALALYVAYKQWGEFMLDAEGNKVLDACDNPISYKQELLDVVQGLVGISTRFDKEEIKQRMLSGMIGLDGYVKGGNTYPEVSNWASQEENYLELQGVTMTPEFAGSYKCHTDYLAPAYYHEFYELLKQNKDQQDDIASFEIEQFRRGEASSDWLIGKLISKNEHILPMAGNHTLSEGDGEPIFEAFSEGEDFRAPWRTISNYVWHGNSKYSWNPVTHAVIDSSNTYEYDAAVRLSSYLKDPAHWNEEAGTECWSLIQVGNLSVSSPCTVAWNIDFETGKNNSRSIFTNWTSGVSSFAAVGSQDYDLMGQLYNICYTRWDTRDETEEGSLVPRYFDGWFRQLGMMALTGNYAAPSQMNAASNVRIYRAEKDSISACRVGDTLTYQLSYRNYGSKDAEDVVIVEQVPAGFKAISISDKGVYDAAANIITWKIGKVAGFKSDDVIGVSIDPKAPNFSKTIGEVSYTCVAKETASGKYTPFATIEAKGCEPRKSDLYSNAVTATLSRNSVEIIPNSLNIEKNSDAKDVAKGDTVNFTIAYSNSDSLPVLTGGHPNVSFVTAKMDQSYGMRVGLSAYVDTDEPFVNLGNYRITYFLKAVTLEPKYVITEGNPFGSMVNVRKPADLESSLLSASGIGSEGVNVSVIEGVDSTQMVQVTFSNVTMSNSIYLYQDGGSESHTQGLNLPLRVEFELRTRLFSDIDFSGTWSQLPNPESLNLEDLLFPITPSYAFDVVEDVDKVLKSACETQDVVVETVLVEEFDGHNWRKVLGESPINGYIAKNVTIVDTIPAGLEFIGFSGNVSDATFTPLPAETGFSGVVSYTLDSMAVGECGSLNYKCRVVGKAATISLGSAKITANVDGSSVDNATSNELSLTIKEPTDVKNNTVVKISSNVDVYNVQGQKLKSNVNESEATNGLSNGVYLVGDKKVVVNK